MECEEFLQGYSSYLDGRADPPERENFDAHLESCDSCARYHRVMRRGLEVFRDLPRVTGSSDFLPRLQHRLYHVDDRIPYGSSPAGNAALVAVAAVGILALAWLPFAVRAPVEVELPAVAVEAPPPAPAGSTVPSLFEPGPFVAPASGAGGGAGGAATRLLGEGEAPAADLLLRPAGRGLIGEGRLTGARSVSARAH